MPEDRKDEFAAGVVGGGLEAEEEELAGGLVCGGLGTEEDEFADRSVCGGLRKDCEEEGGCCTFATKQEEKVAGDFTARGKEEFVSTSITG